MYHKGGVLVSLSGSVRVVDSSDVSLESIAMEVLCTALRLPSGQCILLTVVYRSQSVSFDVLLETMVEVLTYLEACGQGMIWVISMKICCLSQTQSWWSSWPAVDIPHTPTTDKGTLIDHVYCNSPAPECANIHNTDQTMM